MIEPGAISGAEMPQASETAAAQIGTDPFPNCHLCGATGVPFYRGLQDCIRTVAGTWDLKRCPDPNCGLAWLDPMPREEEIGKAYKSYYTHAVPGAAPAPTPGRLAQLTQMLGAAYLQGKFGYRQGLGSPTLRWFYPVAAALYSIMPGGRDLVETAVCFLRAPQPGGRFLEVGFGDGSTLARMRELGWSVVGIEVDPVSVANTRSLGLDTREGPLKSHAFPDASFDAIYASHVVEHVHDPLGLLQECLRILKPGGTVVMTTPNLASWGHRRFKADWVPLDSPRHLMLFTPQTLRTLVGKAGFRTVGVRSTARVAFLYFGMSELYRRLGRLDRLSGPWPKWAVRRATIQHIIENLLMVVNPQAGDELLLMAKK
jgi:SAM-dependent methyltransferase